MYYLDAAKAALFYNVTLNTIRKYQTYGDKCWRIRSQRRNGAVMYAVPEKISEIETCFDGTLKGKVRTHLMRHFEATKTTSDEQIPSAPVENANAPQNAESASTTPPAPVKNPFIEKYARDFNYCMKWAKEEAKLKERSLNVHIHSEKGEVYAIADLIAIFEDCTSKDSFTTWRQLRMGIPGCFVKGGTAQYFYVTCPYLSDETQFCTPDDFFVCIIPMMKGKLAQIIYAAKNSPISYFYEERDAPSIVEEIEETSTVEEIYEDVEDPAEDTATDLACEAPVPVNGTVTLENPFIQNNATNLTYCLEWALVEAKRKKRTVNTRVHPEKGTVYGIVDMIGIFGEYTNRASAKEFWRLAKNTPPNPLVVSTSCQFYVTLDYFTKPMDFCTLVDFFNLIIPRMRGNVARTINSARGQVATLFGTGSESVIGITAINREAAETAPDLACDAPVPVNGTVTLENTFIANNATNLTYCLEWALVEAKRKNKTVNTRVHPEKGTVYGIVDMIGIFGEYVSRNSEKSFWQRLRESTPMQNAPGSNSRKFYVTIECFSNQMDFCTLMDFFNNVIPNMRGKVAQTINSARGQVATLVGTGSESVIGITAINREAADTAPAPLREAVETMRTTTERNVITESMVPVQSTLACIDGSLSIRNTSSSSVVSARKRKHDEILTECRTVEQGLYAIQISETEVKAGMTQTNLQHRVEQIQSDFPQSFLIFIVKSGNPTRLETKLFDHPIVKKRRKTVKGKSRSYTEVFQLDEDLTADRFEQLAYEMEFERQRENGDLLAMRKMELEFQIKQMMETKSIEREKILAETERERIRVNAEVEKEKLQLEWKKTEVEKEKLQLEWKKAVLEKCNGEHPNGFIEIFKMLIN